MTIQLIIGLKNPGEAYAATRHNAGAWFVTALCQYAGADFKQNKQLHSDVACVRQNDLIYRMALPHTFMNHSGLAIQALSQYYKIKPQNILIAHDDLDLPVGRIKLKTGGGHGGHNGLRDIITQLNSNDFHRLRIGIGHPGHKSLVHNYVLQQPSTIEFTNIMAAIERILPTVFTQITLNIAHAMT